MRKFIIRTDNGQREWLADDADHAREQHDDAFFGDPGEEICAIFVINDDGGNRLVWKRVF